MLSEKAARLAVHAALDDDRPRTIGDREDVGQPDRRVGGIAGIGRRPGDGQLGGGGGERRMGIVN
jgi:hypothetical protein